MIWSKPLLVAVAWLTLWSPAWAQTVGRPMTVDDSLRVVRFGEVVLSPDGRQVLYELRTLNWAKNEYESSFLVQDTAAGSVPRIYLTAADGGERFRFSPDGHWLAFLRKVERRPQLHVISTQGGEARPLTRHPSGVDTYDWSGNDQLVFVAADTREAEAEQEHERGDDAYFVDEAPNGKKEAAFKSLWRVDVDGGVPVRLTHEPLVIQELAVAPDRRHAALIGRPDTRTNYVQQAELYLADLDSGSVERLTNNRAPESHPVWSTDGTRLAYRAPSDTNFELRNGYFWVMDVAERRSRRLEGQRQGEVSDAVSWSGDGGSLLYGELRRTATNLFRLDLQTGVAHELTDRDGSLEVRSFSRDGTRVAYTYETAARPPELFVATGGSGEVAIVRPNQTLVEGLALSDARPVRWQSTDGFEIEGLFYPAIGRSGRTPLIVHIHGGPAGVTDNRFRGELQVWAGLGYAVLAPNYRGSTGYGDQLLRGLIGQVGDGEHDDLLSGVDYAIASLGADPEKLAVRGWSWGGVSTAYLITHTDRFKAASIGGMVGNWAAETGPGFNFDVSLWYIGGTPWDAPEEWAKRSAITYVRNIRTPSILFHGGDDDTSSVNQSLMFFTALRDIGRAPVRYLKFPREGHGIQEPRHLRRLLVEEIRWFERHVEGVEWTPWALPAANKPDEAAQPERPGGKDEWR